MRYLIILFLLSSCGTVTINNTQKVITHGPDYQERKHFFLFGTVRNHIVDINKVCKSKSALQMRTEFTPMDTVYGIITFGIYTPRTASVWCRKS